MCECVCAARAISWLILYGKNELILFIKGSSAASRHGDDDDHDDDDDEKRREPCVCGNIKINYIHNMRSDHHMQIT
jgi:hypothetical protein